VKTVKQNWRSVMPASAYPPIKKEGKVSIEFVIEKAGKVNRMKLDTESGDVALDRAAWGSVTLSSPFPPLPTEFLGHTLGSRFNFYYNLRPTYIIISPCADVRVLAGSTQQFSASRTGITETSVTWSVSGTGCSKSACGTISDSGLYTAPVNTPNTTVL
jgi:TonB family protein